MRHVFALLCIGFVSTIARAADERDDHDEQSSAHALSLFQALAANWSGLDSFDAKMVLDSFHMSPKGKSAEQQLQYRLMCDFRNSRFLQVVVGSHTSAESFEDKPDLSRAIKVFSYNEDFREGWLRNIPGKPQRLAGKQPEALLAKSGFPDLRYIGCYETPRGYTTMLTFEDMFDGEFHSGKEMRVANRSSTTLEVFVFDAYGSRGHKLRRGYLFDLERLVPTRLSYAYGIDDTFRTMRLEELEWEDHGGVMLPVSVSGSHVLKTDENGKKSEFTEQYDVSIQWNSVNEILAEEMFRPQLLRDTEKIIELVPVASSVDEVSATGEKP